MIDLCRTLHTQQVNYPKDEFEGVELNLRNLLTDRDVVKTVIAGRRSVVLQGAGNLRSSRHPPSPDTTNPNKFDLGPSVISRTH
ncbi:hypothetical protein J6590_033566 [Homalodisca vitripennis]|nr:hypothetical protein J6590_033566 [Homalodisca vitripennis]